MKGVPIFISVIVLAASTLFGQQNAPEPPASPGQPRPPGVGTKPGTPAQNVVAVPIPVPPPQPNGPIQKSLVRITATEVAPDYRAPWNAGMLGRGIGAGFVVDGNRIMTNAHVVSNSRFLTVERDGDPNKYPAKVLFVAHDCDLALITVDSPNFYKNMLALKFGGIPELESTVSAYGYPIGGERMSVTTGIVSRIDFQLYTHSSIDQHLAIQISAQINPGNSGGPVMLNGKVVGVAFQGYSGDLAQRRYFGLPDDGRGVVVRTVIEAGPAGKVLKEGDVLLSIDDHAIASDGFVELEGERVEMPELVERKFKGDKVKFEILRDKKPLTLTIELDTVWPYQMQAHHYDTRPRYVVYGGLIFQPLSLDLLDAYQISDPRVRHYFDYYILEQLYLQHPDIIVLTNILPDPTNTYLGPYRSSIVDEVNGKKIATLNDLAQAFAETPDRFVIKMIGQGPPLVLDRKEVESARERIRIRYNVIAEQNLEEQPVAAKATASSGTPHS